VATTKAKKPPWKKTAPKKSGGKKSLTPAQKKKAKASAKRAGRPYPNLVDNMNVAKKKKTKPKKTKKAS
jgi:hypothetical protein